MSLFPFFPPQSEGSPSNRSSPKFPLGQPELQHYWDLWNLDPTKEKPIDTLQIADEFEGEEVVISEEEIEDFCKVVGNEGEAYKKGFKGGMKVPMDFAIKLGWKVSYSFVSSRSS